MPWHSRRTRRARLWLARPAMGRHWAAPHPGDNAWTQAGIAVGLIGLVLLLGVIVAWWGS
jgi:hypothetical protein